MNLFLDVSPLRVWVEIKSDIPFVRGGSKIRRLPPLAFPGRDRPSAFRRYPLWLVAVGADGWFLVIFRGLSPYYTFKVWHGLTRLCMEGVLAPGSVGGCAGRLRRCLSTAGMWRALFIAQYSHCAGSMLQVRIPSPPYLRSSVISHFSLGVPMYCLTIGQYPENTRLLIAKLYYLGPSFHIVLNDWSYWPSYQLTRIRVRVLCLDYFPLKNLPVLDSGSPQISGAIGFYW